MDNFILLIKRSRQLRKEWEKLEEYTDFVLRHTEDSRIHYILAPFKYCPSDIFCGEMLYLAFPEVVALLNQGEIDKAKLLAAKCWDLIEFYRYDGPRDLVESGRLLSSGK